MSEEEEDLKIIVDLLESDYDTEILEQGFALLIECLENHLTPTQSFLDLFPTEKILTIIINNLRKATASDYRYECLKIVRLILQININSASFVLANDFPHIVKDSFIAECRGDQRLEILSAINILAIYKPEEIGCALGIRIFFQALDVMINVHPYMLQPTVKSIRNIVTVKNDPENVLFLQSACLLLDVDDLSVFKDVTYIIKHLTNKCKLERMSNDTAAQIIKVLPKAKDDKKSTGNLFRSLLCLSQCQLHWSSITSYTIDFTDALVNQSVLIAFTVISLNILPWIKDFPFEFPIQRRNADKCDPKANQYCKMIKPITIQLITTLHSISQNLLYVYIIINQLIPEELPKTIFNALSSLASLEALAPGVLKLASMVSDQDELYRVTIIPNLANVKISEENQNWFATILDPLLFRYHQITNKVIDFSGVSSLSSLCEIAKSYTPTLLLKNGFCEKAKELLTIKPSDKFINAIRSLLDCIPIPVPEDPYPNIDPISFSRSKWKYFIGNDAIGASIIDCGASFKWVGSPGIDDEVMEKIIKTAPSFIKLEASNTMSNSDKGYAGYFFASEKSTPRMLKFQNFQISMNDNLFLAINSCFNNICDFAEKTVVFNVNEFYFQDGFKCNELTKQKSIPLDMISFLDLLEDIHHKYPDINLIFPEFEDRIKKFSSAYSLISGFSPHAQIVANYPFLFGSDLRIFVFMISSLDISAALDRIGERLYQQEPHQCKRLHACAVIRRNHIWEDGVNVLTTYGKTPVHLDFKFENEIGYGIGPMNEFFHLMSLEFSRNNQNLWMSSQTNSEYAFLNEVGLFPLRSASLQNFYIFGIFCAKAINSHSYITIPLSDGFFKLLLGETLTFPDIGINPGVFDDLEGLVDMPFVFPGTEFELIPDGNNIFVTKDNASEYKALVKKHLQSAEPWKKIKESFMKGFYTCIRPGYLSMLTVEDFSHILLGEIPKLTMEELKNNINVGNGFQKGDEEITWIFEVISSLSSEDTALFLKFLTGCPRFPPGGISAFNPQISISMKNEYELPSAMTCHVHFKISKYESKAKLEKDFLFAIRNCQGSFFLS